MDHLKKYYEDSAHRFWDAKQGMVGRDLHVYPFLEGLSGTVLEYGCGSGSFLLALAREDRFSSCIGVDISENALAMVRKAWAELKGSEDRKLKLFTPTNDQLHQIPDKSVDVLISLATIEHVVNPYVVLDELHRVASDNAVLICNVPNYGYIKHVFQLLFGVQPRTGTDDPVENWRKVGWDGMHLHTFTKSSLSALLKNCGWNPIRWSGWGERFKRIGFGLLRRYFPGTFSGELTVLCRKVDHPVPLGERIGPANLPGSMAPGGGRKPAPGD